MWGATKKSGSLTSRAFDINADQWTIDCSPGRGGMSQNDRNKGRNISWRNGSLQRKPPARAIDYVRHTCSGMPERDGKDQEEDSPKQAGSCWFARPC